MAERFNRDHDVAGDGGARSATTVTDEPQTRMHDPARDRVDLPDRTHDDDRDARHGVDRGTMAAVRERQREEFGGIAWGSAFFGWLTATGLGAILAGILSAVGAALALTEGNQIDASNETIGLVGGIALLVVLFVSYFAGGYVAGRMARFDGFRQGVGVFLWAIFITAALAIAAVIGGSEWNVLERMDLPRLPVDEGDITTGGIIALAAGLLTMLIGAVLGGKLGEGFHRKVDRHAVGTRR
ncbi:MAG: YrzE family protein [Actinomycetota bacterium]|nr:YrzE family protein [Actinomycetota bacterium]MDQ5807768.1 YrzE family protein [Actinomycetota bacterium]